MTLAEQIRAIPTTYYGCGTRDERVAWECGHKDGLNAAAKLVEQSAADDALPIDEAWLESVGFVFPNRANPTWEQHCYAPLLPGMATSRLHFGCPMKKPPFAYAGTINLPHIKTRGDVRRLCEALGIDLTPKP